MNKILNNYLEAVKQIDSDGIQYYTEAKIKDDSVLLDIGDFSTLLHNIIYSRKTPEILNYFYKGNILSSNFWFLYPLGKIEQNKHKSSTVMEHTIRVVDMVPVDNIDLKWAALFHDIGKIDSVARDNNFFKHAFYSYEVTKDLCNIYSIQNKEKICTMVLNHMIPGGYQKNPNWSDEAVKDFMERCHPYGLDVIELSYCDKKAETDKEEFLEAFKELKERAMRV